MRDLYQGVRYSHIESKAGLQLDGGGIYIAALKLLKLTQSMCCSQLFLTFFCIWATQLHKSTRCVFLFWLSLDGNNSTAVDAAHRSVGFRHRGTAPSVLVYVILRKGLLTFGLLAIIIVFVMQLISIWVLSVLCLLFCKRGWATWAMYCPALFIPVSLWQTFLIFCKY